jgi:hypothetical protein
MNSHRHTHVRNSDQLSEFLGGRRTPGRQWSRGGRDGRDGIDHRDLADQHPPHRGK